MKSLIILVLILLAVPSSGQWRYRGNIQQFAFANHDTSFFFSGVNGLGRINPLGDATGIDYSRGPIVSFASLGKYFLAGGNDSVHDVGVAAISSDNGSTWEPLLVGGPVGTNGTYFFARKIHRIARSRDSGATWEDMTAYPSPQSVAGDGAIVYMSTSNYWMKNPSAGIWRSLDSGGTWTHLSAPFNGPLLLLGTLLFTYQPFHRSWEWFAPPHNGVLIVSRDSGMTWDTVRVDSAGIPEYLTALATDGKNLFAGGSNQATRFPNGVYISRDSGKTWNAANDGLPSFTHIEVFGFFDTLAFISTSSNDDKPFATYDRPIKQLVPDDSDSLSVVDVGPSHSVDSILIYPNPSPGIFTIVATNIGMRSVAVLNLLGQVMMPTMAAGMSPSTRIDLSELPAGTYFLRIETDRGIVVRKVVRE